MYFNSKKENVESHGMVFYLSLILTAVVVILNLSFPTTFLNITTIVRKFLGHNFAWYYLVLPTFMVGVCLFAILSPIGKIKLGLPGSKPEYSTFSWLSMLFSAGMGIGLVFYGAAEPLSHFAVSSPENKIYSQQALEDSLKYSFFHYGIHAWAVYAVVALALAYFQFRKIETTLISVTLKPLFGDKTDGILGKIIDTITIFATVVGVATSLGLGAAQINGGLNYLFDISQTKQVQLIIIFVATALFILSALSGIGKGVKILSNLNILIAIAMAIVAMIIGPTLKIMNTFVSTTGLYMQDFIRLSLRTAPGLLEQQKWLQGWTIFYWAWWIAWSPFVGVFIARISKGRTIREFLIYVLLVPSFFSFYWFSVFGVMSTSIAGVDLSLAKLSLEKMLFGTLSHYPLTQILSLLAIFLVFSFFVTSADSATYVLAMQSENGKLNPKNSMKVLWGILLSLIAATLLLLGGLDALQNVLIIVAFPFSIILLLVAIALIIEINYEKKEMGLFLKPKKLPTEEEPFRSYQD